MDATGVLKGCGAFANVGIQAADQCVAVAAGNV
jgi:hypothetical protein